VLAHTLKLRSSTLLGAACVSVLLVVGCSLAPPLTDAIVLSENPPSVSPRSDSRTSPAVGEASQDDSSLAIAPIEDEPASLLRPRAAPVEPAPKVRVDNPAAQLASRAQPATPTQSSVPAAASRVARSPVDAMVGQINGRPLFASEFFETMDARLRAEAERRSPEDWLRFTRNEIRKALRDRIRDELLLAEVESSLTPGQRAGLVTFVRSLRENMVSENRGSHEIANRRLLEEEGITLEQAVQARRDEELIRSWLGQILRNKVHISWRDVEQRYDRDFEKYHPPATATLRMIRIRASAQEEIDAVSAGLANGEEFADLAITHSSWKPKEGGLYPRQLDADTYEKSSIIGLSDLNAAAQKLSVGEYSGPLEIGKDVYWIMLEEISQSSQSLYEVQLQIRRELFNERINDAEGDYFDQLLERSGLMTTQLIDQMEARLFDLAAERYLLSRQD
jgi:hypothetical protein